MTDAPETSPPEKPKKKIGRPRSALSSHTARITGRPNTGGKTGIQQRRYRTHGVPKFLKSLMAGSSVSAACVAAGFGKMWCYAHRKKDAAFAAAWDEAVEIGVEALEDEATRRGVHGVDEPVFHAGKVVGHVRKYSDTLLIFLLKGKRPEKYRDNVNVTGAVVVGTVEELEKRFEEARRRALVDKPVLQLVASKL